MRMERLFVRSIKGFANEAPLIKLTCSNQRDFKVNIKSALAGGFKKLSVV